MNKAFKSKSVSNIIGWFPGKIYPNHYLVLTAHYDHLGKRGHRIFNGANDNASGFAALLVLVRYYSKNPPAYNQLFVSPDGEEDGLYGAKYFVENPPVSRSEISLNINMDMLGHGARKKRLYIAGTRNHKHLKSSV